MSLEKQIEDLNITLHATIAALQNLTQVMMTATVSVPGHATMQIPAAIHTTAVPVPPGPVVHTPLVPQPVEAAAAMPAAPFAAPAPAAVPSFMAPPAAPPTAAVQAPFSDLAGLVQYATGAYHTLGAERGAGIQQAMTALGYQNINDIKPEDYGKFHAAVEALNV